jgi:hypothetical protein
MKIADEAWALDAPNEFSADSTRPILAEMPVMEATVPASSGDL